MITWRSGKAGFVGGSKTLIKGVFSFQHAVSIGVVVVPTIPSLTFDAVKPQRGHSALKPLRGHTAIKPRRGYDAVKIAGT